MRIELGTVRESPFVGIFAVAAENRVFVPSVVSRKEEKMLSDVFGRELVKTSIANSALVGVLSAGNSRGLVVGSIIEARG